MEEARAAHRLALGEPRRPPPADDRRPARASSEDLERQVEGRAPAAAAALDRLYPREMATSVRIGTCSWADQGLLESWYPPELKTAESRLRYYAERYDTVEVNSSYYAIPDGRTAERWAERTPDGFVFHVKAFGLMTGHAVLPEQLPPDLRPLVRQVTSRGTRRAGRRPAPARVRALPPRAPAAARRRQARRHPDAVPAELRAVRGRVGGDPATGTSSCTATRCWSSSASATGSPARSARRRSTRSPTGASRT